MPFQTSQAYHYRTGNVPAQVIIPKDVVVPFLGNTATLATLANIGWTQYVDANGYYLASTTSSSQMGRTTLEIRNQVTLNYATGNAGEHSGDTTFLTDATYSQQKGQNAVLLDSVSGSHTHNVGFGLEQSQLPRISMNTQNVTYIRASRKIKRLPEGALLFKETSDEGLISFGSTGTYIVGAYRGNVEAVQGNQVQMLNTATGAVGSGHTHSGVGGYDRATTGVGYNYAYAGTHRHLVGATHTQSSIGDPTKFPYQGAMLLNAWKVLQARLAPIDTVVMYIGDILKLPTDWYLCDGTNGTINIGENVIGFSGGAGWMVPQTANSYLQINISAASGAGITTPRFAGDPYVGVGESGHDHNIGQSGGPGFASARHNQFDWNHTHTLTGNARSFHPATYKFAFIQYKGKLYNGGAKYGAGY